MYIFVHAPHCHLRTGRALFSALSLCFEECWNRFIFEMLMVSDKNKRQHNGVISQPGHDCQQANTHPYREYGRICFYVTDKTQNIIVMRPRKAALTP